MLPKILIIYDQATVPAHYPQALTRAGLQPDFIQFSENIEDSIQSHQPELVILDLVNATSHVLPLLNRIYAYDHGLPCVVLTEGGSIENAVDAMKQHALDYITKPMQMEPFIERIKNVLSQRRTPAAARCKRNIPKAVRRKIVGASEALENLLTMIQKVARTDINVLIVGESGTGKEVVARTIHQMSSRNHEAFVPVDCASFPENLLESELFGYKKGAFTGAVKDQKGLLEFANRGTLFLDEIGEMPILLQAKLLRVLQERQFRPIGGLEQKAMNVRVLAATNRQLEDMVEEKTFRQDLYFRLNVMTLAIPPLRERTEDIPLLAQHFLRTFAEDNALPISEFTGDAMEIMEHYKWPGNVRELQNMVESAATICTSEKIGVEDLPESLRDKKPMQPRSRTMAREEKLNQFQREYLVKLLTEHDFNISRAARTAGCHRRTIYRMIDRYRIDVEALREQYTA